MYACRAPEDPAVLTIERRGDEADVERVRREVVWTCLRRVGGVEDGVDEVEEETELEEEDEERGTAASWEEES